MSEKHLTEPLWKTLVAKQGVKDIGLGKALAAYSKLDATTEPAAALDALKEVNEFALKLKKLNPSKEEVVAHLDEIIKEVKKTTPGLEARIKAVAVAEQAAAKSAETSKPNAEEEAEENEEDEEKEAAEFKKDLKKQMVSALVQVKMRAPGEPGEQREPKPQLQFMAYVAGKVSAVIVGRKVGSATKKLLPDIAGGVTGGKFFRGECIFEKNAHTFVLETVPGGLAKKLTTALNAETGQKYKVRVRSIDGAMVLDSDTDVDPDAVPDPGAQPDENEAKRHQLAARLGELQKQQFPPTLEALKKQALEKAAALGVANKFAEANQLLDQLAAKAVPAAPLLPGSQPSTAKPAEAQVPPPSPGGGKQIKLSTYLAGRGNLRTARENAEKELKRLQEVILAKAADEPFFKEVQTKAQKLFEYLAPIDDEVANKLDDAGRCVDPEEQALKNTEVRKAIQKQLTSLRNHPLSSFVEKNPFGKFIIKQPLEVTLSSLDKQLS